ncbi:MAG: response regulator [Candidatus Abyssobacteria bacterium SURF_17]|jgi:DNA-binding NtrC family response regulator|uniref:Response regulator n=1 Tax=Candidatus Abyssobacteria bacterium SURF_17 TaxID=2093361 RepID=A0A419F0V4_9BACT|nr:MAG: response regulator [Candidatus Abyssubacteria bacterium SURF_17]
MDTQRILVVDDEKNIRATLQQTLEAAGYGIATAVNGEDCLSLVAESRFHLILLDLKLPGMGGIQVLEKLREKGDRTPVIIITAYGTIESAVDAMKLGAIDYLRKPFSPEQIRDIVKKVLARRDLKAAELRNYADLVEYAKRCINEQDLNGARDYLQKALAADSSRAEAFNLLGVVFELSGNRVEAQKRYRAAIALDATYDPAHKNLKRTAELHYTLDGIDIGPGESETEKA